MTTTRQRTLFLLIVVAFAWVGFFYSGRALLVWQWTDAEEHRLNCYYVSANDAFEREHLYTEGGWIGSAACPRLLRLTR